MITFANILYLCIGFWFACAVSYYYDKHYYTGPAYAEITILILTVVSLLGVIIT